MKLDRIEIKNYRSLFHDYDITDPIPDLARAVAEQLAANGADDLQEPPGSR